MLGRGGDLALDRLCLLARKLGNLHAEEAMDVMKSSSQNGSRVASHIRCWLYNPASGQFMFKVWSTRHFQLSMFRCFLVFSGSSKIKNFRHCLSPRNRTLPFQWIACFNLEALQSDSTGWPLIGNLFRLSLETTGRILQPWVENTVRASHRLSSYSHDFTILS